MTNSENSKNWFVDINKVRTDYVVIENLKQFLSPPPPKVHPNHPDYKMFWSKETKKCIEGVWGKEWGKYRFMPGNLYFLNYTVLEHTKLNQATDYFKPSIVDYYWDFAYISLVTRGFSGFDKDENYSSNRKLKDYYDGKIDEKYLHSTCYNSKGNPKQYVDAFEYLCSLHDEPLGKPVFFNETIDNMILGSRGGGKATPLTTPVLTDNGWVKMGDIKVGDKVYGRNGKLANVIAVHPQGELEVYIVKLADGREVECCKDHLWLVKTQDGKEKVLTTESMFNNGVKYRHVKPGYTYKYSIPNCKPIEYSEKDLHLHPYISGCNFCFLAPTKQSESKKDCEETIIPELYKTASVNQRLELLKGLLDVNGTVSKKGNIKFESCSLQLIKDVADVCRSLGIRCKIDTSKTNEKNANYRLFINTTVPVFGLQDKLRLQQNKKYSPSQDYVSIVDIVKTGKLVKQQCITVDNNDHTYITTDYVVTHNSYYTALAELEYRFVFNNAKSYKEFIDPRKRKLSKQCVGSGEITKSADLLAKVKVSQDAKTRTDNSYFREIFGIWGKDESDPEFKPCPFYRKASGNFDCPNKQNPYRNEYRVMVNGEWKPRGSGSAIFHVNYNSKKGKGAQAATGGRYDFMDYEEVGEMDNYVEVKGSNENCVKRGIRFGVQWAQGTSGNINYIMSIKEVFLNPQDYNILAFPNKNGSEGKEGKTGYFLPNYMVLFHFKDENGNTDFEAAIRQVNEEREKAAASKDPKVLMAKLMNEPCYTHEMWITDKGYYLPYEEAAIREKELMRNNAYKNNHVPVELYWDNTQPYSVGYRVLHNAEPHFNFPIPKDMKDPSGCIVIYEFPTPDKNGIIPNDMYMFIGYDNYVEQDLNYGGSLGVTYILKNPKYIPQGYTGNIIVASYIGKPAKGLDYYHEQQEKLIAMYGSPLRGLWFEKNRGDLVREYYIRKHKPHLLCITPQRVMSSNIYQKNIASYGFIVGNQIAKINLIKLVNDWLLEETTFEVNGIAETKKNIQRIPCLFLIRQIMQYNLEGNFDAVSALIGCVLGLREYQNEIEDKGGFKNKNKNNIFAGLLSNPKIYKNAGFAYKK